MGPLARLLNKKVESGWLVAVFVLGLLLSQLMFRAVGRFFEFLTGDGPDGAGLASMRPVFWLLLIGSLAVNFWLVRRVRELEEVASRWQDWAAMATSTTPPTPPGVEVD